MHSASIILSANARKSKQTTTKKPAKTKQNKQPNTKMLLSTALRGGTFLFCALCMEPAINCYYLAVPTEKIPDTIKVKVSLNT